MGYFYFLSLLVNFYTVFGGQGHRKKRSFSAENETEIATIRVLGSAGQLKSFS